MLPSFVTPIVDAAFLYGIQVVIDRRAVKGLEVRQQVACRPLAAFPASREPSGLGAIPYDALRFSAPVAAGGLTLEPGKFAKHAFEDCIIF